MGETSPIPNSVKRAMRNPVFAEIVHEVAEVAQEEAGNLDEVLITFPPEYTLAVLLGGVVFDESDRFRINGWIVTESAADQIEACGIPISRIHEPPGERIGKSPQQRKLVWQSETVQNGNIQDSISGEKITQVRKKPRINQIRSESIQLG